MVEITYQMVLSTLQTVALIVGIYYYVVTIRANQRNREISLMNQQLRTAYSVLDIYRDEKEYFKWLELMNLEWVDYDDFHEKYLIGASKMEAKWGSMCQFFDGLGYLWKKGVLDLENLKELIGFSCVTTWTKFKPIVERRREKYYLDTYINWQHLAEALEPMISDKVNP
jgi:hypothetical protein